VIDGTTGEAASPRIASGTASRQLATHPAEQIDGTDPQPQAAHHEPISPPG
jgi:hypothetical protein